jgi:hypothetical protein
MDNRFLLALLFLLPPFRGSTCRYLQSTVCVYHWICWAWGIEFGQFIRYFQQVWVLDLERVGRDLWSFDYSCLLVSVSYVLQGLINGMS